MGWEPGRIGDGAAATAAGINILFSGAKVYIDDLDDESLAYGCFNENHFQSRALLLEEANQYGTLESDDGDHVYLQSVFTTAMEFTTAGADSATDTSGNNPGSSDRIVIGHPDQTGPYADGLCQILTPGGLVLAGGHLEGILVLFNCNLKDALDLERVFFCLQFQLDSGSWYTIDSTERMFDLDTHVIHTGGAPSDHMNIDVSIASLITRAAVTDVGGDPDTEAITGIRACVSGDVLGGDAQIILNRYNLSGLFVYAEKN